MRYQNNSHVTDDVMSKVLWGSTVSYTSDSLASYYLTVPTVALMLRPSDVCNVGLCICNVCIVAKRGAS